MFAIDWPTATCVLARCLLLHLPRRVQSSLRWAWVALGYGDVAAVPATYRFECRVGGGPAPSQLAVYVIHRMVHRRPPSHHPRRVLSLVPHGQFPPGPVVVRRSVTPLSGAAGTITGRGVGSVRDPADLAVRRSHTATTVAYTTSASCSPVVRATGSTSTWGLLRGVGRRSHRRRPLARLVGPTSVYTYGITTPVTARIPSSVRVSQCRGWFGAPLAGVWRWPLRGGRVGGVGADGAVGVLR